MFQSLELQAEVAEAQEAPLPSWKQIAGSLAGYSFSTASGAMQSTLWGPRALIPPPRWLQEDEWPSQGGGRAA